MTNAALHVARTGLDAQQSRMQVIANNLANVNTTGFKRDRANFQTLAYQTMITPGSPSSGDNKYATGLAYGTGVRIDGTQKIDTQGTPTQTGNSLDVMVQGSGFFQVQMPDGTTAYTRDGNFTQTAEGLLVTSDGMPVLPNITLPQNTTAITIGTDGTVSATVSGQTAATQVGQIQTATFTNPSGLASLGNNLMQETAASGNPQVGNPGVDGHGTLLAGSLEGSNVNVVEELVDMIECQRAYEVNSKAIKASDDMLQYVNQQL
jgi:flagellar basal-body rod protein FlgG